MIELGIIGTNWITQQFVDAVKLSREFDLTSVYSRHDQTVKTFAAKNGAQETFTDLNAFFKNGQFETVYIASPNSLHFEQAQMAIQHNKNVIVEKPAFSTQKQMAKIQALLDANSQVRYFEAARNIHTENFHAIEKNSVNLKRCREPSSRIRNIRLDMIWCWMGKNQTSSHPSMPAVPSRIWGFTPSTMPLPCLECLRKLPITRS